MYHRFLQHIRDLALAAGRDPERITLVAVTKECPLDLAQRAYGEGARDFGENRVSALLAKKEGMPSNIRWHMIGTLQKNKVSKLIGKCAMIHSVDSLELAEKISACSHERGVKSSILLQVNVSGEESKQGFSVEEFAEVLHTLRPLPNINIEGLMTIAPLTEDEDVIRGCFSTLCDLRDEHLPGKHLSMGMSHDYTIAIQEGATLLRVGSAIFSD